MYLCLLLYLDVNDPSPLLCGRYILEVPTGNTCYFNAVLQCLFALPAFVESVVEWCDLIDAAADGSDDKENSDVVGGGGRYRLLRATRTLAKVKMAGKQGEVRYGMFFDSVYINKIKCFNKFMVMKASNTLQGSTGFGAGFDCL